MPKKNAGLNKMIRLMIGLLLLSCGAFAQKTITGKVINKTTQQPVTNATVQVKGTVIATRTDSSGDFSIRVPKDNSELEISSVGFATMSVPLAGKSSAGEIQLAVTVGNLNEVFVTGYTSQKKKDITGAVSIVNVTDLKATPSGST
ncbi:MAG TPA: carboxypeptidase-like regulatory domain-containing protein, partial [Puia sp.]|nr:carboxypeptidase-like regulatory domain-containing protein [Puia sp.]